MVQKTSPGTLNKHKKFFCENTIFVKKIFAKKDNLHLWVYLAKSFDFNEKSFKLAKSRYSENFKLVRQVYKVQEIPLRRHNQS